MSPRPPESLSRRERQVMDVLFNLGSASVADVQEEMSEEVSYSAARAVLRVLEEKGHVEHRREGPRYVYSPTLPRETARRHAIRHLVRTFFDGSTEEAAVALLQMADMDLDRELEASLLKRIREAEEEGR